MSIESHGNGLLMIDLLAQSQSQPHLDFSTWIALVIGACATMWVLMRAKRKREDPLENKPVTMPLAQQRAVERQMSSLLVELSDMSREISANLDTRAAKPGSLPQVDAAGTSNSTNARLTRQKSTLFE